MASRVQPPENTDIRARSRCSARPAGRRTSRWPREELRGARPRRVAHRPAPGIVRSRRWTSSAGLIAMTRAAANSMASGTPSRRWQISTTERALLRVKAKSALTCRARSTNKLMASVRRRRSMSSLGSPTASGGSAISCSPSIAMPSRLVASTTTPGHSRSMRLTSRATAPSTCSQLSSTNSNCFWDSISTRESSERLSAGIGDAKHRRHRRCNTIGIAYRGELDQPRPVPVSGQHVGGHL